MMLRTALPRLLLGLAVLVGASFLALNRDRLDPALIETAMRGLGPWGPVAHVALFALGTVLFVPGALFGQARGVLIGPAWGTLLNLAGATLGATAAFLVARYVAVDWVRRRAGARLERLIKGVEAEGWRFVALTRLVPLIPSNLLNYALGLTRIPALAYVLASLVCMAPGALAYTWAMTGAFARLRVTVERGATWTTDAPLRETRETIEAMTARGLLAVEMEAAALYAFAAARGKPVLCFAHVTNQMALIEGDFEKGEADGTVEALAVVCAAVEMWRCSPQATTTG
jgi:uncharacterized membrane protein YdjX (TVP38/TMEM64 family)